MSKIEVGSKFILDIKRLGINGEGIGFYNKMAIFVKNAIPGEGVNVEVYDVKQNMAFAKVIEYKHQSPFRVEAKCPYYEKCGACQVMHIDYNKMCEFKRDLVIESLNRYTTLNTRSFEIKQTLPSNEFNYRNRNSVVVLKDGKKASLQMIEENSNKFIKVDSCMVLHNKLNEINKKILECIDELDIPLYNPKYHRGVIRFLSTRISFDNEAVQVCFVCLEKTPRIKELAQRVLKIDGITSVYENFNDKRSGAIFGSVTNHIAGDMYIVDKIGHVKFNITPTTFFQLNPVQCKNMYDVIKKVCKLSRNEVVLDAYCGVGTIGLYLANMAKEVVGIEYNKESVKRAIENAKMNKINNASFYQGDAKELVVKMMKEKSFDVLVLDPPRTGLGEELCNAICDFKIKRVIYTSCNHATLAKDLEILKEFYKVNMIQPIDMFPNTSSIECITVLCRNEKK